MRLTLRLTILQKNQFVWHFWPRLKTKVVIPVHSFLRCCACFKAEGVQGSLTGDVGYLELTSSVSVVCLWYTNRSGEPRSLPAVSSVFFSIQAASSACREARRLVSQVRLSLVYRFVVLKQYLTANAYRRKSVTTSTATLFKVVQFPFIE